MPRTSVEVVPSPAPLPATALAAWQAACTGAGCPVLLPAERVALAEAVGAPSVVVTHGAGPVHWFTTNPPAHGEIPVPPVPAVDTAGAGDAFHGALAIGLARWRGRGSGAANFLMLFPLVTPEIVMGASMFLIFSNLYHIRLPRLDHFIVVCIHCILVREIFFKGPDSFLGNYCIEVSALHDIRLFRLYTVQIHQFIPDISRDR